MVSFSKHLGILFGPHDINFSENTKPRIALAEAQCKKLLNLGLVSSAGRPRNTKIPVVASVSIFKAFIRPILEFGNKLRLPPEAELENLEMTHDQLLQDIVGRQTRHPFALRAALRIQKFDSGLRELQLVAKAKLQLPKTSAHPAAQSAYDRTL